jgi:plasmid stability protein
MKLLQVGNVPDDQQGTLKSRAARAGLSLSDYVLAELRRSADRPTRDEVLARIAERGTPKVRRSRAAAVRAERDGR